LDGARQLLVYADDINTVEKNTDTIKTNTEALLDTSMEAGQEVKPQKAKYMLMSHYQ
jgi:hypothetical protein